MCQEGGTNLELAYGPGLTGIINIGSSCYISAVSSFVVILFFSSQALNSLTQKFLIFDDGQP